MTYVGFAPYPTPIDLGALNIGLDFVTYHPWQVGVGGTGNYQFVPAPLGPVHLFDYVSTIDVPNDSTLFGTPFYASTLCIVGRTTFGGPVFQQASASFELSNPVEVTIGSPEPSGVDIIRTVYTANSGGGPVFAGNTMPALRLLGTF